ncbi:anaerobic ribonucleoside-triphosphate reductase activating protein [Oxalobacteraceae bacterium GrIS 2.11]
MQININKAHYPVTVLGPGKRIGIWLQGCSIGCKGCVSQDTWDSQLNRRMSVAQLLAWCKKVSAKQALDGITLSGGEPFDQPEALSALLDGLHQWRRQSGSDWDILCYSGYPYSTLKNQHTAILNRLDVLIPEPFIDQRPTSRKWRGSENQTLELLTERGQKKYGSNQDESVDKQIQVMVDGKKVWYIGIPQRGDMARLEQHCLDQGLAFVQPSWRS